MDLQLGRVYVCGTDEIFPEGDAQTVLCAFCGPLGPADGGARAGGSLSSRPRLLYEDWLEKTPLPRRYLL